MGGLNANKDHLPGLSRLGELLLTRAGNSFREKNPIVAEQYREFVLRHDLDSAVGLIKSQRASMTLEPWEGLLKDFLDVELSLTQVRSSLRLLKLQPDPRSLTAASMTMGGWVHYHTSAWSLILDGFLERSRTLIRRSVRALTRPSNKDWKSLEVRLTASIEALSLKMGEVRNPVAHGGGPIEAIAEEGILAGVAFAGVWLEVDALLDAQADKQERWHGLLLKASSIAVDAVDKALGDLADQLR